MSAQRRPALRYMGWWALPALGLVMVSLAIIYPYTQLGGAGRQPLGQTVVTVTLADCPVHAGVTPKGDTLIVRLRLDPSCAQRFSGLEIRAVGRDGSVLTAHPLSGNPNSLEARMSIIAGDTSPYALHLSASERAATQVSSVLPLT